MGRSFCRFVTNSRVWQTDGRTYTDISLMAKTALHIRRAVKKDTTFRWTHLHWQWVGLQLINVVKLLTHFSILRFQSSLVQHIKCYSELCASPDVAAAADITKTKYCIQIDLINSRFRRQCSRVRRTPWAPRLRHICVPWKERKDNWYPAGVEY